MGSKVNEQTNSYERHSNHISYAPVRVSAFSLQVKMDRLSLVLPMILLGVANGEKEIGIGSATILSIVP